MEILILSFAAFFMLIVAMVLRDKKAEAMRQRMENTPPPSPPPPPPPPPEEGEIVYIRKLETYSWVFSTKDEASKANAYISMQHNSGVDLYEPVRNRKNGRLAKGWILIPKRT